MGSIIIPRRARPSWSAGFARSQSDARFPSLWDGLVGHWAPSLGATGGALFDVSGRQNNGVITGSTWDPTGALSFDGSVSQVVIPSKVLPVALSHATVCAWFYVNTFQHSDIFISGNKAGSNAGDWQLSQLSDGPDQEIRFFYDNATSLDTNTDLLTTSAWHFIAATLDEHGASLYVNGAIARANATAGVIGGNAQDVFVGRQTNGDGPMDGFMRSLAIYNRALTPSEIQLIDARGRAGYNAILERKSRVLPVATAAPPSGLSIPIAMHHYQHNLAG